jgi:hypothetical protein
MQSIMDNLLEICKKQGYVPVGCRLDGHLVLAIVNSQDDPCRGCNEDRKLCGGRYDKV